MPMRYYLTLARIAVIITVNNLMASMPKRLKLYYIISMKCEMIPLLWKTFQYFLNTLNIEVSCNQAIFLLDIFDKALETGAQAYACICRAVLFAIARRWKEIKNSWMYDQLNIMWYIHTTEYYSLIKSDKVLI